MVTLSIVQSMMMIIPVAAFTMNQYQTMRGWLAALRWSPTLRFIGVGGLMYTASSVQGSFEALRSMNAVTHFTHYTVGHAHLGLYGFVSFVFFGAMYFVMPRITARDGYPRLISAHFWLVAAGIALYFTSLTIGGWLQGEAMLDASRPFMDSVAVTLPYLKCAQRRRRPDGAGPVLVFAAHFIALALGMARSATSRAAAPMVRQEGGGMNSEIRLLSGAMVTLALATSALVVLPYLEVHDAPPLPGLKPMAAPSCAGAPFTSPTAACTATRSSRAPGFRAGLRPRLGRATVAGDYAYDQPQLLGTMRTRPGSDEHRRAPAEQWHLGHLYQPRAFVPGSIMPSYPFLFEAKAQADKGDVVVNLPALARRPAGWWWRGPGRRRCATCSRSTAALPGARRAGDDAMKPDQIHPAAGAREPLNRAKARARCRGSDPG